MMDDSQDYSLEPAIQACADAVKTGMPQVYETEHAKVTVEASRIIEDVDADARS